VRRYAIASYDKTTLARRLYTSARFTAGFATTLAIIFGLLLLSGGGKMETEKLALFSFIPFELIHNLGIAVLVLMGIGALVSVVTLLRNVSNAVVACSDGVVGTSSVALPKQALFALREVIGELVRQRRFRSCDTDSAKLLILRPWFVHYSIMWGFFGLLLATILDFLFKDPALSVPIWYPPRLIGTIAGILLTYGVVVTIIRRSRPLDATSSRLMPSDWLFLWLLLAAGVLGFAVEVAVYLPAGTTFGYLSFLVHVSLAMELLILFPFTKFAHALYRPVVLYQLAMARSRRLGS